MIRNCQNCRWLTALKLNENAADVRSNTRHVAREKSCVLAFLFPHSLLFCVHGMLAHQLHNGWLQQLNSQLMMPRNSNSSLLHIQLAAGRVA